MPFVPVAWRSRPRYITEATVNVTPGVTSVQLNGGMDLLTLSSTFFNDKQDSGPMMQNDQNQSAQNYNPFVNHMLRVPAILRYTGAVHYEQYGDGSIVVYSGNLNPQGSG